MDPKEVKKKSKKMKEDFSKFKVTTSGDFMGQNIHEAFDKIIKTDFAIFMINDDWLKDHRAMQECYTAAMREIPYVVLINSDMKLLSSKTSSIINLKLCCSLSSILTKITPSSLNNPLKNIL